MIIDPIAYIRTEFSEKFGIPRQSGLAGSLRGKIVFEPEYRNPDALRGMQDFSHLWLIWEFSANRRAIGRTISIKLQNVRTLRLGSCSADMFLYEYEEATYVMPSKVVL